METPRLAIITTHPIQYNAPLFELLHQRGNIKIRVFYTWGNEVLKDKFDPDFGKVVNWDIDLLKGYDAIFLENVSKDKGSHHYHGIDNPDIIGEIKKYQPNAILVYGWPLKSHLHVMRYFKGKIPVLFRGDSTLLDEKVGLKSLLRRLVLRWVYRYVDKAFFVGKNNFDYFIKSGLKSNQLEFMPHAVDNKRFDAGNLVHKEKAMIIRDRMGIKNADTVFLFAGKLESKKNPLGLMQAFLENSFSTDIHLVFVGNGHLEQKLKLLAAGRSNIHFIDFVNQSEMPVIYQICDVFVLPSVGPGESWGLAVNEAMASGKALLVSDKCGCAATLIQKAVNGFVFAANDMKDLKQCMKKMVDDRPMVLSMGAHSLELIKSFSFNIQSEVLEKVLTNE